MNCFASVIETYDRHWDYSPQKVENVYHGNRMFNEFFNSLEQHLHLLLQHNDLWETSRLANEGFRLERQVVKQLSVTQRAG